MRGEMAERSKAHAWKVCNRHKRFMGSNPILSANLLPWAAYGGSGPFFCKLFKISLFVKVNHTHRKDRKQ